MPSWRASPAPSAPTRNVRPAGFAPVVVIAFVAAVIVVVSQFTTLYAVRVATSSIPIKTVGTGANHAYALLPLALVAMLLAFAAAVQRSRAAPAGLIVLGIVTLLIALLGDLPDTHTSGLIGSSATQYVKGASSPGVGLYMETLGAVLLLAAGGVGLLMPGGPPTPPLFRRDPTPAGQTTPTAEHTDPAAPNNPSS
jgi:hypothetical protein